MSSESEEIAKALEEVHNQIASLRDEKKRNIVYLHMKVKDLEMRIDNLAKTVIALNVDKILDKIDTMLDEKEKVKTPSD